MRVINGYATSPAIREAFRALGHDAWTCDLLPSDDGSPYHIQGDIWDHLDEDWDLGIFHPTCTYLTNSAAWAFTDGPYHQRVNPGTLTGAARRNAREIALQEVRLLMELPFRWAIENPKGSIGTMIKPASQIVQPYEFGDDASKGTCLWLSEGVERLPIDPWVRVSGRMVVCPKTGRTVERWSNQTDSGQNKLTPGPDRWKERSKTYQGIANAMAKTWGGP